MRRHALEIGKHAADHVFIDVGDHYVEGALADGIDTADEEGDFLGYGIGINVARDYLFCAQQFRCDRQDAAAAADVQDGVAGFYDLLHRGQAFLRAGMLAGATLRSGIYFETEAAFGCWFGAPGGDQEEFLAHQDWWPRVFRLLDPVDFGSLAWVAELGGGFAVGKEGFDPAVMLDDAEGAGFVEVGDLVEGGVDYVHGEALTRVSTGHAGVRALPLNTLFFAGPEFFLQDELADFASAGFRERLVGKFDDAREFEFAQALL